MAESRHHPGDMVLRAVPYEARIVGLVINAIVVDAVSLAPIFASVQRIGTELHAASASNH